MTPLLPEDELPNPELAPRRLLEGGAGERERDLIASARLDRVPSDAKARAAAALGGVLERHAAPSAAPHDELARVARGDTLPRIGARSTLTVVGAGVVGAIALWLLAPQESSSSDAGAHTAPATPAAVEAPGAGAPASGAQLGKPPVSRPPPSLDDRPVATPPSMQTEPAEEPVRPSLDAPPRRGHSEAQRRMKQANMAPAATVDTGLLAEVRALEAVSAALAARDSDRAERELAAYRRRFARGELAIEADVLAIEIAASRGDRNTAKAGAERLLTRPEAEHYRARVRALLERTEQPLGSATPEKVEPRGSNEAAAHMRARR